MKILLVNTLFAPNAVGGAEKSVQQLAESLASRGHEPYVVSLSWDGKRLQNLKNGVRRLYLPIKNLYFPFEQPSYGKYIKPIWHLIDSNNRGTYAEMCNVIAEIKPDVVHTNNLLGFSTSVWDAASENKVPSVHTLRDYYLLCPRQTMFKRGRRCKRICTSCLPYAKIRCKQLSKPSALIGVSKRIVDIHAQFAPVQLPSVVTHVYNGVDIKTRIPEMPERSGQFTVGFLGRISDEKGVPQLIKALTSLTARVRLIIGGRISDEEMNMCMELANGVEIEFLGFTTPENVLSRVHYLVVPSLWEEPFSRVVIESYAHGVPVIASKRGGMPEIIEEGKTGYLFEPEKENDLIRVLNVAANSGKEWQVMSGECLKYAQSFSAEIVTDRYIDIYDSVIEKAHMFASRLRRDC